MKIKLSRRTTGKHHAHIEGQPDKWGQGNTPSEAIGDLLRAWPEEFNAEVEFTNDVR